MIWPRKQKQLPLAAEPAPKPDPFASNLLHSEEFVWQDRQFRHKLLHLLRASLRSVDGLIARADAGPVGRTWNVLGWLKTDDGRTYGYQLTFSRVATSGLKLMGTFPIKF